MADRRVVAEQVHTYGVRRPELRTTGVREPAADRVVAVVPIKPLPLAKSRLALPAEDRQALALAFALDTITSLAGSRLVAGIVVVTSDDDVARRVRRLDVRLVRDDGSGLDAALGAGIRAATPWSPSTGVVVVPADLPCLQADDVTHVLAAAAGSEGAFVPDRSGTGTTLVVLPPDRSAVTRYGPGSADRHRLLGLMPLEDAPLRARHDVDTLDDLRAAAQLGIGPETRAVMAARGLDLAETAP
ncbi:MAG: 2-phospho-L-lactate/phosphoenolpyruvate guanylyltransferase [Actinomycetota bacterium]|nr:2-phospho-L-lactate/phosphoenolpyruvate guanylyltransferase [Actinomycetota bacterium]